MVDQLDNKVQELVSYLDGCEELAPIIGTVAAVLLDKRAYDSAKLHPVTDLQEFVHKIVLTSDSVRQLLITDNKFERKYLEGKFLPSVFGLPREEVKPTYEDRHVYEVCISYAYEDRAVAKRLARHLRDAYNLKVFFDEFEQHNLVGEDLIEMLYDIYARKSLFCVVLFSKIYLRKDWTRHELRAARARALEVRGPYILPVALEQDAIPEELATTGYWRLKRGKEVEIAELVHERFGSYLATNWINEDELKNWFQEMVVSGGVLSGFELGIEEAGEGPRADLLRLLGMVASVGASDVVPSVRALLEFVVYGIPVVAKEFDGDNRIKVFGDDAYVRRWLGHGGPLVMSKSGWDQHMAAYVEHWKDEDSADDEHSADGEDASDDGV